MSSLEKYLLSSLAQLLIGCFIFVVWSCTSCLYFFFLFFISWRLITLQYCSGFCHTLTWISHGYICIPHPNPPSHLPLHPIPLGLPSEINSLSFDSFAIIFSHYEGCLFILLIVPFFVQKLLSLIGPHLFCFVLFFAFISNILGGGS